MLKSSLLEILRTFSKQELTKFEDFVRSPYFNKKENVLKLFLEIKKYTPAFSDENLAKEKVWTGLFPGKEYNYGIMKNLIFDLNKLSEQFIMDLKYTEDEYKKYEYLLNALLDRKLNNIFINKYRAINTEPDLGFLNANNLEIPDYLNFAAGMFRSKLSFHENYDKNFKSRDLRDSHNLYKISNFLIFLFDAYRVAVVKKIVSNSDLDQDPVSKTIELVLPGIEELLEIANSNSASNAVYMKIYFFMYNALNEKTESSYFDFKRIVFSNLHLLPKHTLQDLHLGLLTVFSMIKHENSDMSEVIEIYDSLIENKLITLLNTDIMPIHIFNNYISACFYQSDSVKLEKFASGFLNKLEPKHAENSKVYVKFMISFINKDFNDALMQISLLEVSYAAQKTNLKYQKVMCIYELGDYEMFLNEFDSLKHFLRNNSFITAKDSSKSYTFYSIIKSLFDLKKDRDGYEIKALKSLIKEASENSVLMNKWFMEKIKELENYMKADK